MNKGVKLNVVINIVVITVTIIAGLIVFYSSAHALKISLTQSYLNNNRNYTNKLAEGVEYITNNLQKIIAALADLQREKYSLIKE